MIPIAVIPQLTENPLNSKNNHNHLAYGSILEKNIFITIFLNLRFIQLELSITSIDKQGFILILGHWSKLERRIFAHGLRRKRYDVLIFLPH